MIANVLVLSAPLAALVVLGALVDYAVDLVEEEWRQPR